MPSRFQDLPGAGLISRALSQLSGSPSAYIVSYPKSGRTWLRALVGKSISLQYGLPEAQMLETAAITRAAGLPVTRCVHDGSAMTSQIPYQELPTDKRHYRGKPVVLLGREVKDTLVSAYFQATRRVNVFEGSMSEFIRSDRYGARKVLEFYRIWWEQRHLPRQLLFLSYEDLHQDTAVSLQRVLQCLNIPCDPEVVAASVEACSFKNLRRAEAEAKFSSILQPAAASDPESYKVRRGKVGGYEEYLTPADIEYVDMLVATYGCEFTRR